MVAFLRGQVRVVNMDLGIQSTVYRQTAGYDALIISNDQFNSRTSLAMVLSIDYDEINRDIFDSMRIETVDGIPDPAWVRLDQIRTVPNARLGECLGTMEPEEIRQVLKNLFGRMVQ